MFQENAITGNTTFDSLECVASDPKGRVWTWESTYEQDGDGFNYWEHFAVSEGERRHIRWSRFKGFSPDDFRTYVEAGRLEGGDA